MEKTLRAEVESDINSIPIHQRGSIITLRCIIKQMVIKNQEAKQALENYNRTVDITKFPGKNVPTTCLCLNAIAGALGDDDLPTNTIRKVIEGYAKLSTNLFNNFCTSQTALRQGSFYMNLVQGTPLLQSQLNDLLNNLEVALSKSSWRKIMVMCHCITPPIFFLGRQCWWWKRNQGCTGNGCNNQSTMGQMGETICQVPPLQRKRTHPSLMPWLHQERQAGHDQSLK